MKVYYLKQKSLDMLEKEIPHNIQNYQSYDLWVENFFVSKDMSNYYFDTGIEVPEYKLIIGGPETDFQNAKIIYETYAPYINLVQASDLRLWAYLAHVCHWDYMSARWKIDMPEEDENDAEEGQKTNLDKIKDRIGYRYFFKASKGKAFVRHGISRLFWSAYLTYDEGNENPYEYTEFFFSKQDIFTSITERSYARNKVLVLAILKELKSHPDLGRTEIRLFLAKLNQAGAIKILDFLNKEQAEELCSEVMSEVVNIKDLKEGSKFKAIDNLTGRNYGPVLSITQGKVMALGKIISTKPKNLVGKKEGAKFTIAGRNYIIKEIH